MLCCYRETNDGHKWLHSEHRYNDEEKPVVLAWDTVSNSFDYLLSYEFYGKRYICGCWWVTWQVIDKCQLMNDMTGDTLVSVDEWHDRW